MTQQLLEDVAASLPTLLVVEDDLDIQSALQDLFAMAGYKVVSAGSGTAAMERFQQEAVDLVVLDVKLPDMNGFDVCKYVRESDMSRTPIVMLTALTQQHNVTAGLASGADDYVKKPFAPEELLLRVKRLLQRQEEVRSAEHEATRLGDMLALMQRQLQGSQDEKTIESTLRREFLHNVTTHMQALCGIVEAASRKIAPGPERDVIQQLKGRVRSAALVYEISEALQEDPVEVDGLIRTIASALKTVYRPWRRVVLTVEGERLVLPLMIASPLAMIVNELVTNALKHAFPDNRFGKVAVSYAARDTTLTLDVVDDGIGFDQEQPAYGRGRPTVTQLVQSLGGSVAWQSSDSGTQVHITIPLTQAS